MSAEPSLFDAVPASADLRNSSNCQIAQSDNRMVDASHLGAIRAIVVTESGAEIMCAGGTLLLSVETYLDFVRYRKAAAT